MVNGVEMDQELIQQVKNGSLAHKNMKFSQELVDDTILDTILPKFDVTLTLSDNSTKEYELFRFGLADNMSNDEFVMDLDRDTLKGMADFILKYLENN